LPGGGKAVTRQDVERFPVYSLLQNVIHRHVSRATVQVRAAGCTGDVAKLLNLGPDATILHMERTSYDADGLAVETTRFSIPPEVFAFQMEVAGPLQIASSIKRIDIAAGRSASPPAAPQDNKHKSPTASPTGGKHR
jgi:GntR family transcriptional regulator